jgi:hypothetical protein
LKYQSNLQIISGGQTGVDRAALDFALEKGLIASGWCSLERMAEDGTLSFRYPLQSTFVLNHLARTEMNVQDSDATLIIYSDHPDKGTESTRQLALMYEKPLFIWNMEKNNNYQYFHHWMKKHNISVLNIAGPRASNDADIYHQTLVLLENLFSGLI